MNLVLTKSAVAAFTTSAVATLTRSAVAAFTRSAVALCGVLFCFAAHASDNGNLLNDYPTKARADYVFGCMAANSQTQTMLDKCSCSIDRIAAILPYEKYVEAETVLSLRQVGGERMSMFKTTQISKELVADLRRAQAEAEILCFE